LPQETAGWNDLPFVDTTSSSPACKVAISGDLTANFATIQDPGFSLAKNKSTKSTSPLLPTTSPAPLCSLMVCPGVQRFGRARAAQTVTLTFRSDFLMKISYNSQGRTCAAVAGR